MNYSQHAVGDIAGVHACVYVCVRACERARARSLAIFALALSQLAPFCCCCHCATGMGIEDFSTADQWAPLAKQAIRKAEQKEKKLWRRRQLQRLLRAQPVYDLAAIASPLRLSV